MLILLGILVSLLAVVITYYKWSYQYWKRKGVVFVEPSLPFGSLGNPYTRNRHLGEVIKDVYDEYKKRGCRDVGLYTICTPSYIPIDLDYVKNIMTKDFSHFVDRGAYHNEKDDPLSGHLFNIGGVKWRNLRVKLTPTFTSGKMKMMFSKLVECGNGFKDLMDRKVKSGESIDIKEEVGRMTTDIIGSCAFGLEFNTIEKEHSPFRTHGKAIFERSRIDALKIAFAISFPDLARALHIRNNPPDSADFFMKMVKDNLRYREENNFRRPDLFQTLVDLKKGKLDSEITEKHDGKALTDEEIAAQCFVFFLAGFETSSTTTTFAMLEMCQNQEIQERARKEVMTVLERHNGEITYEAIQEMKYLQQVIDETLRKYPPVAFITRDCVKDYKIPDQDVVLDTSVKCLIPVLAIHRDPEIYPDPDRFDPERFSEENKKNRHQYAFLAFGEGPRICIGMRFGYLQTKVGLVNLLKNYRWTLDTKKTQLPIRFSPTSFVLSVVGDVWIKGQPIKCLTSNQSISEE